VTISPEKITLQREKEHCAIFIHAHFMWGLQLGLGLSKGVRVGLSNRLNKIIITKFLGLNEKN